MNSSFVYGFVKVTTFMEASLICCVFCDPCLFGSPFVRLAERVRFGSLDLCGSFSFCSNSILGSWMLFLIKGFVLFLVATSILLKTLGLGWWMVDSVNARGCWILARIIFLFFLLTQLFVLCKGVSVISLCSVGVSFGFILFYFFC